MQGEDNNTRNARNSKYTKNTCNSRDLRDTNSNKIIVNNSVDYKQQYKSSKNGTCIRKMSATVEMPAAEWSFATHKYPSNLFKMLTLKEKKLPESAFFCLKDFVQSASYEKYTVSSPMSESEIHM
jgi:hypothetical protein